MCSLLFFSTRVAARAACVASSSAIMTVMWIVMITEGSIHVVLPQHLYWQRHGTLARPYCFQCTVLRQHTARELADQTE
jgi:hypothetical protein